MNSVNINANIITSELSSFPIIRDNLIIVFHLGIQRLKVQNHSVQVSVRNLQNSLIIEAPSSNIDLLPWDTKWREGRVYREIEEVRIKIDNWIKDGHWEFILSLTDPPNWHNHLLGDLIIARGINRFIHRRKIRLVNS